MMRRAIQLAALLVHSLAWAGPSPEADAIVAAGASAIDTLSALEAAKAGAPDETQRWLEVYRAETLRLSDDLGPARKAFRAVDADPVVGPFARVGLTLIELETKGLSDARIGPLMQIAESELSDSLNADRFAWLAVWSTDNGQPADGHARKALTLSVTHPEQQARIEARLGLAEPSAKVKAKPTATVEDPLEQARMALAHNDRVTATKLATLAQEQATTDDQRAEAQRLLTSIQAKVATTGKVGVLLPLKGRFGAVGEQMREALTYGWNQGGRRDKLVVVDAGETADSAVAALHELVEKHGVIGIAGPLLTPQAEPVAKAAEALGVPLIELSQSFDNAADYRWVIQGWMTPTNQIERLADYAITTRDWHTFVILHPNNAYGDHAAAAFKKAVEARGGKVSIIKSYDTDATDFRPSARAISRRRGDEGEPVIDFDAIFLPDKARRISLVTAGLAFEEVPMGRFQPHRDRPVGLLGLSGWNSDELIGGGGGYTYNALFTDVFVPPPDNNRSWYPQAHWERFVSGYREATSRTPTPVEALAVDVGRFLAAAANSSTEHRQAFLDALYAVALTDTVTAATGIDATTHAFARRIRVLSVKRDGFAPVAEDVAP